MYKILRSKELVIWTVRINKVFFVPEEEIIDFKKVLKILLKLFSDAKAQFPAFIQLFTKSKIKKSEN